MYYIHCPQPVVQQIVSELPSATYQSVDILTDKHTLKEIPRKPAGVTNLVCKHHLF